MSPGAKRAQPAGEDGVGGSRKHSLLRKEIIHDSFWVRAANNAQRYPQAHSQNHSVDAKIGIISRKGLYRMILRTPGREDRCGIKKEA